MNLFYSFVLFVFTAFSLEAGVVSSSSAYLTANLTNATGNGPVVAIPFDAVSFDDASCFNLSNGQYTAPGDGTLIINGVVEIANLSSNHNTLGVVVRNSTRSEQRYMYAINPYPIQDTVPPSGYSQLPYATTMKCTEGDIFILQVFVIGGTQTVNIIGGLAETRFSLNYFAD